MANKNAKCKHCGEWFDQKTMVKQPCGRFCTDAHMFLWLREKQEKAHAVKIRKASIAVRNEKKASRKDLLEFNQRNLGWQHKQTQKVFNKMRVLEELLWFEERNLEPTCISCGKPKGNDQWCCGHFKTRGAQGGLRYDRWNTMLQHNYSCNMRLSGDISGSKNTRGYKVGLLERFGAVEGQSIIDHCETNTAVVKWTCQQLEQMRTEFNQRVRDLQKERK